MTALVRRWPLLCFYVLALAIALGVMAIYAVLVAVDPATLTVMPDLQTWLTDHQRYSNAPNILWFAFDTGRWSALLILLFAAAPTLAAVAATWAAGGRDGVGTWLARLRPCGPGVTGRDAAGVYAALAAMYAGGLAWFLWLALKYGSPALADRTWSTFGGSIVTAMGIAAVGVLIDEGGTLEELGWRGFALPLLQERWSPLAAALVLGLLWWAWHLPREIPAILGGMPWGSWLASQGVFALLTVALSIVIAYCVNRTGGSVLPAIIIHGGTSVWSKAASTQADVMFATDVRTCVVVVCALTVTGVAGRRLGRDGPVRDASAPP
jgi:membrane protease YdiL (CAAX protease family)